VELDQLRSQLERDSQILAQMSVVAKLSESAAAMYEAARNRHQLNLQDTCRLLQQRLAATEARNAVLEKECQALKQAQQNLIYKNKKLNNYRHRADSFGGVGYHQQSE